MKKQINLFNLRKAIKQKFKSEHINCEDADFIIAEILNIKRTELTLIDYVTKKELKKINICCKQRLKHKPVDKIFKKAYFCGYSFYVNKHVLTPRQDSEILVEQAKEIINNNKLNTVLDLCCGSGCLGLSICKQANIKLTASDISQKALQVAKHNANNLGVDVELVKSNMFKKINKTFDVIISNPPYIESAVVQTLETEVKKFDPKLALDGGEDGLNFYRIIAKNVNDYLNINGYLILEIGYNQKQTVKEIFKSLKYINCYKDLGGKDRVIIFRRVLW